MDIVLGRMLLVIGVDGGLTTHVGCCAESRTSGSSPLLFDLDIVGEMGREGHDETDGTK